MNEPVHNRERKKHNYGTFNYTYIYGEIKREETYLKYFRIVPFQKKESIPCYAISHRYAYPERRQPALSLFS